MQMKSFLFNLLCGDKCHMYTDPLVAQRKSKRELSSFITNMLEIGVKPTNVFHWLYAINSWYSLKKGSYIQVV